MIQVVACIESGCTNTFEITDSDLAYFKLKKYMPPKRCYRCRANRRVLKGGMIHPLGGEHHADSSEKPFYHKHL